MVLFLHYNVCKMKYNPLFDVFWGPNGNIIGHPCKLDEIMKEYEEIENETFEVTKGDYKTTIICKFNSKGYLISHIGYSEDLKEKSPIMENLIDELHLAYEEERYEDISSIQKRINKCRDLHNTKPTF